MDIRQRRILFIASPIHYLKPAPAGQPDNSGNYKNMRLPRWGKDGVLYFSTNRLRRRRKNAHSEIRLKPWPHLYYSYSVLN